MSGFIFLFYRCSFIADYTIVHFENTKADKKIINQTLF